MIAQIPKALNPANNNIVQYTWGQLIWLTVAEFTNTTNSQGYQFINF